jgi:S1-C subfamily serine protease
MAMAAIAGAQSVRAASSFAEVVKEVQPKIVKIFGAGGIQGLEAYQSGFLFSAEGHILTAWSYVLDTDVITVTLDNGRRFQAQLVGADPALEVAVLKIDAIDLPHFDLSKIVGAEEGARVLAFSNLFRIAEGNEPVSVLHGSIAIKTHLAARRGVFDTPYQGQVYVLDAMTNNPGSAGGALTNRRGDLLGMLGKELRNARNNTWLNFAIPTSELATAAEDIRSGKTGPRRTSTPESKPEKPVNLARLGVLIVPNVLERTPPFVDEVRPNSPAAAAGVKPDDLVVFVGEHLVQSIGALESELELIDSADEVRLTLLRGQELVQAVVAPLPAEEAAPVKTRAPKSNE